MESSSKSKFNNMKISKKLLLSFGIVILLTAIMIAFGIYFVLRVGSFSHLMYVGPYVTTTEVETIRADINESGIALRSGILDKDMGNYEEQINGLYSDMAVSVNALREAFDGQDALLDALESSLNSLKEAGNDIIETAKAGDYDQAANLLAGDYKTSFDETIKVSDDLYETADTQAASFDKRASIVKLSATIFLCFLFACTLIFGVIISGRTTKSIVRPLRQIEKAAKEMAGGNLEAVVNYVSEDELGSLAGSMRTMISTLSNYITDISRGMKELAQGNMDIKPEVEFYGDFIALMENIMEAVTAFNKALIEIDNSATQVSEGAELIAGSGHTLSQGSEEQTASIQQLSATIHEISERIYNSSQNAQLAKSNVELVENDIEESNRNMKKMVEAMENISKSSNEISNIIKTIESIATQTNLLSLNAAIEAARAGEAGKGFAVVADEVRNLAAESAEASKNSTALIKDSIDAVQLGMEIVGETASSLLRVVENARVVTSTVEQISEDAQAQASAIQQISDGVGEISNVIAENNAAIEQSAASSQELSAQAAALKGLVEQFQVKRD